MCEAKASRKASQLAIYPPKLPPFEVVGSTVCLLNFFVFFRNTLLSARLALVTLHRVKFPRLARVRVVLQKNTSKFGALFLDMLSYGDDFWVRPKRQG